MYRKLFVLSAALMVLAGMLAGTAMGEGYAVYQGPWPAGPHYRVIHLTYGELNPFNEPASGPGYWPYPSPFVIFPGGIQLDPMHLPLGTLGTNTGMGSTDAVLYQQWANYGDCKTLFTLWWFIKVGPEPQPGELHPRWGYFMRPWPWEGVGNYYYILNIVTNECVPQLGVSGGTIGYWKNARAHYDRDTLEELLFLGQLTSIVFDGVTPDNLRSVLMNTKSMPDRARAQLIATWLDVLSGRLGLALMVNISSIPNWQTILPGSPDGITTVNQILYRIEDLLNAGGLSKTQYEAIKDIADGLNNGILFIPVP